MKRLAPAAAASPRRRFLGQALALAVPAALAPAPARAQAYPARSIRLVVPYSAGGGADSTARLLGQAMEKSLGAALVIDNRPGASGAIGAAAVAQAPADGYTVLYDTFPYAVNAVTRKLPFDPAKDLLPVSQAVNAPNVLVVPASAPYSTVADFLAYARAHPGELSYASYGAGGAAHLAGELLKQQARVDMVHVPYKGGAPALTDVMGGQVAAYFANTASAMPYLRAGKLRALAVTSGRRVEALPNVPTLRESGLADYELLEWNGCFVPRGTPPPVIDKLAAAVQAAVRDAEVRKRLADLGVQPVGNRPDEFAAFLQGQMSRWSALIKAARITLE